MQLQVNCSLMNIYLSIRNNLIIGIELQENPLYHLIIQFCSCNVRLCWRNFHRTSMSTIKVNRSSTCFTWSFRHFVKSALSQIKTSTLCYFLKMYFIEVFNLLMWISSFIASSKLLASNHSHRVPFLASALSRYFIIA